MKCRPNCTASCIISQSMRGDRQTDRYCTLCGSASVLLRKNTGRSYYRIKNKTIGLSNGRPIVFLSTENYKYCICHASALPFRNLRSEAEKRQHPTYLCNKYIIHEVYIMRTRRCVYHFIDMHLLPTRSIWSDRADLRRGGVRCVPSRLCILGSRKRIG